MTENNSEQTGPLNDEPANEIHGSSRPKVRIRILGDVHTDTIRDHSDSAKARECAKETEKELFQFPSGAWHLHELTTMALEQCHENDAYDLKTYPRAPQWDDESRESDERTISSHPNRRFCRETTTERDTDRFRVRIESGQRLSGGKQYLTDVCNRIDSPEVESMREGGNSKPGCHILALHDAGAGFFDSLGDSALKVGARDEPNESSVLEWLSCMTDKRKLDTEDTTPRECDPSIRYAFPLIIASMSDRTPQGKTLKQSFKDSKTLWGKLYREHRDRTMVVVNASALRHAGANISSELSWEQTAQEFVTEIFMHDTMKELALFRHLVVRLGHSGAIYSSGFGRNTEHHLFYHPTVSEDLFCQSPENTTLGGNKIFIASIIEYLVKAWHSIPDDPKRKWDLDDPNPSVLLRDSDIDSWISDAVRLAVLRVHNQQVQGHSMPDISAAAQKSSAEPVCLKGGASLLPNAPDFFQRGYKLEKARSDAKRERHSDESRGSRSRNQLYPYIADARIPVGTATWTILSESSEFDLERVAAEIVYQGLENALNASVKTRTERLIELIDEVMPEGLREELSKAASKGRTSRQERLSDLLDDLRRGSRTLLHMATTGEIPSEYAMVPEQWDYVRRLLDTDNLNVLADTVGDGTKVRSQEPPLNNFFDALEQHLNRFPEDRMLPDGTWRCIQEEVKRVIDDHIEEDWIVPPCAPDEQWRSFRNEWNSFVKQLDDWADEDPCIKSELQEKLASIRAITLDVPDHPNDGSEVIVRIDAAATSEPTKQEAATPEPSADQELPRAKWRDFLHAFVMLELLHQEYAELEHSKDEYGNIRPVFTPVARFGKLETVDRQEIESLRSVGKLIEQYVSGKGMFHSDGPEATKEERPLSIAVFGQPGGGKSFAVRQIIGSVEHEDNFECPLIEVNLSQLDGYDELVAVLEREKGGIEDNQSPDSSARKTIPVYFFDEFDSKRQGEDLGWLQCFLAMMEDGKYLMKNDNRTIRIGRAIFVFAGATSRTYQDFCRDDADESDVAKFTMAKGPDFVSRLMGHINIVGVNPGSDSDESYLIRRAIHIRSALVNCLGKEHREHQSRSRLNWVQDSEESTPLIERDVLHAMLRISRYRHGARSIRAILKMSTPVNKRIQKSSLPTRAQLEMHVNSKEFFDLLNANGDSRRDR